MIRLATIVLIAAIFSGCSLKSVSKPIVQYAIEDNTKVIKETKAVNKVLKISRLKSPEYIQNSSIWYQNSSFEMNSYLYAKWNEDFVNMIENNIASTVYDSGLFKSTFTKYSKIRADLLLEGEIIESLQKIGSDGSAEVSFSIRLYLIDSENSKLIGSKEFVYLKKCTDVNVKGAVIAYNEIVKNLNKDVVIWLKTLVK
jgi:ABC-type uncharacterized transport system auxiliary subunit